MRHVQVDGQFADGVLGRFGGGSPQFVAVIEGKGPGDPLDRPHGGRRMSAGDQGYRYAINLLCDWVLVTSIRLYYKGADQQTYERFDTERLASDEGLLRKFVFLLGRERVSPEAGRCHLYDLLAASEQAGRELTREFYRTYADLRQDTFGRLAAANPAAGRHGVLTATQKLLDRLLLRLRVLRGPGAAALATRSGRRTSTPTPTTPARSGTTSGGCSTPSTAAANGWASRSTTAACSPKPPGSTA